MKDNPRLAVLPYLDKASKSCGLNLQDATVVSEFLMEQFLDSARFKIVEREKMKEILAEYSLQASGLVNPATAVAVGNLAGAQFLVAGSVTGLSTKKSGASYSNSDLGSIGFNSYTVIANITLRIIDIEDGTVVMAVSGTGESARTNVDVVLRQEIRNYYGDDGYGNEITPIQTSTEEIPSDDVPTDNVQADEIPSDDVPTDNVQADEIPTDDVPTDNIPADEIPTDDVPTDEIPSDDVPTDNVQADEIPTDEIPTDDVPTNANYEMEEYSAEVGYFNFGEGGGYTTRTVEHRLTIGGRGYSMVQVRNALYKAAVDAVYNKDYGLLAKLDGKAKRRKV